MFSVEYGIRRRANQLRFTIHLLRKSVCKENTKNRRGLRKAGWNEKPSQKHFKIFGINIETKIKYF
ncbi:hypothetical protein DQM68_09850 [Leptospira mayottensis]|uniref:Uncharacterized protein n=1 Tax=Leptospira mayottensis TaxID=1137606 RepID=A0ABM6YC09_9LEPT|nr:hypothetical protein DQM68_09850 [Leptospira mayottensis]AXR64813.1 hypothetical protein DQM28_11900 [Leptospira mayottensis]AZQ02625.1 hypothetical protein LEP1GSC190_11835 [Leptospira mayottensis 200901116]